MKTKKIIKKSLWCLIITLAIAVFLEFAVCAVRGYGFTGLIAYRSITLPYQYTKRDFRPVIKYCQKYFGEFPDVLSESKLPPNWPPAEMIAQNVTSVKLAAEQPYEEFNIWVFESVAKHGRYLYKPIPFNQGPIYDDPNFKGIVILCDLAKREEPVGIYHPYKKISSKAIRSVTGPEKWAVWDSLASIYTLKSSLPPVPGAIIFTEMHNLFNYGPPECYYPQSILPAVNKDISQFRNT